MNLAAIDWIWHVRGSLALAPGQTSDETFARLDPLFRQYGTRHERCDDTLTFAKRDQAAQDRMAVFDSGTLRIDHDAGAPVLRYHLISRALLFCFLLPFMFLGIAQLTIAIGKLHKPAVAAAGKAGKSGKAAGAAHKPAPKKAPLPLNPIDKALGAPAPDKPGKGGGDEGGDGEGGGKKPSPTSAYVFAAIFAVLYAGGRILEDRLIKGLFRKRLMDP